MLPFPNFFLGPIFSPERETVFIETISSRFFKIKGHKATPTNLQFNQPACNHGNRLTIYTEPALEIATVPPCLENCSQCNLITLSKKLLSFTQPSNQSRMYIKKIRYIFIEKCLKHV